MVLGAPYSNDFHALISITSRVSEPILAKRYEPQSNLEKTQDSGALIRRVIHALLYMSPQNSMLIVSVPDCTAGL